MAAVAASLRQRAAAAKAPLRECFQALPASCRNIPSTGGSYEQRLHINRSMRVQPDWPGVEMAWENLRLVLSEMAAGLKQMEDSLSTPGEVEMVNNELIRSEVDWLLRRRKGQ